MNIERAQVGWGFWIWWVLSSTVGLILGLPVVVFVFSVQRTFKSLGFGAAVAVGIGAVVGGVFGASVGNAQRLVLRVLRGMVSWSKRWILPSAVGGGVGVGLVVVFVRILELDYTTITSALVWAVLVAVFGASLGIAQWLILRQQVARAGWWVLASTMGILVLNVVGPVRHVALDNLEGGIVALVVTGAGYGTITGGVLVWMLRQPTVKEIGPRQAAE